MYGMSKGGSASGGTRAVTWRGTKKYRNMQGVKGVAGSNIRAGKTYTRVRRADGMVGHDYGGGNVVWVKKPGKKKRDPKGAARGWKQYGRSGDVQGGAAYEG